MIIGLAGTLSVRRENKGKSSRGFRSRSLFIRLVSFPFILPLLSPPCFVALFHREIKGNRSLNKTDSQTEIRVLEGGIDNTERGIFKEKQKCLREHVKNPDAREKDEMFFKQELD